MADTVGAILLAGISLYAIFAGADFGGGLWDLLARTYRALGAGSEPPITPRQIIEVNHLVDDLKNPRGGIS